MAKNWSVWRLRHLQELLESERRMPRIEAIEATAKEYGLTRDRKLPGYYIKSVQKLLKVYVEIMHHGPNKLQEAREKGQLASHAFEM